MSEKRKTKPRRKDGEYTGPGEQVIIKPSKDEYNVAKWLRRNVRTKKTKFLSHNVEYFTANKALDALMTSKFAVTENPLFPTREHAIEYLDNMLEHKFFHRAKKVLIYPEELKIIKSKKSTESNQISTQAVNIKKVCGERNAQKLENKTEKTTDIDSQFEGGSGYNGNGTTDEITQENKEKRKRKIKLDMHPDQYFVDGSEAYVWIYDPIPLHYWIFGLILVLSAIVVCLFPLWPPMLRLGVYYLSVAAAGFLVFILLLTIVRLIIFVIIWVLSGGKLYFWIFPNLTEDVGFFASFWPIYEKKYYGEAADELKLNKKAKKKDKYSDAEETDQVIKQDEEKNLNAESSSVENIASLDVDSNESEDGNKLRYRKMYEIKGFKSGSESESGSRSSTGKDFEMVDSNDVECP